MFHVKHLWGAVRFSFCSELSRDRADAISVRSDIAGKGRRRTRSAEAHPLDPWAASPAGPGCPFWADCRGRGVSVGCCRGVLHLPSVAVVSELSRDRAVCISVRSDIAGKGRRRTRSAEAHPLDPWAARRPCRGPPRGIGDGRFGWSGVGSWVGARVTGRVSATPRGRPAGGVSGISGAEMGKVRKRVVWSGDGLRRGGRSWGRGKKDGGGRGSRGWGRLGWGARGEGDGIFGSWCWLRSRGAGARARGAGVALDVRMFHVEHRFRAPKALTMR